MKKIELEKLLGQRVSLVGTAKDAKGGAVLLISNEDPIYIKGLSFWSAELIDKQVSAIGVLKKEKIIPDPKIDENGSISQGAIGIQLVLEKAKYSLKENIL
ncbi:MAG: hypothetical protein ACFFAN_12130 [Promethearchaeota archaeon]